MSNLYRVAVHYNGDNGYIEYDKGAKTVRVALREGQVRQAAEAYFAAAMTIAVPQTGLTDFAPRVIQPKESVEEFELAMTRLWEKTGVHVDWSRPVPKE